MEWSEDQNLALGREVLKPYHFKARTTERGKVWQQISDNLNSDHRSSYPHVSLEEIQGFLEKLESKPAAQIFLPIKDR